MVRSFSCATLHHAQELLLSQPSSASLEEPVDLDAMIEATKLQIAGAQRRLLATSGQHRPAKALKDDTVMEPGEIQTAAADGWFLSGSISDTPQPTERLRALKSSSYLGDTELDSSEKKRRYENQCDRQPFSQSPAASPGLQHRDSLNPKAQLFESPVPEAPHDVGTAGPGDSGAPSKYDNVYHQMRRYFNKRGKDGSVVASQEALKLWQSDEGREKLRAMLLKHGNFKEVECEIAKWRKSTTDVGKRGMWSTKTYLTNEKHWTKQMLDHAWNWAKENGHWRLNPIHGEEEINIVIEDFFQHVDQQGSSFNQSGTFELEDPDGALLQNHAVPDRLTGLIPKLEGEITDPKHCAPGSFKMVFPTVQQNASILTILPTWIETLGRKIDAAEAEKEKLLGRKADARAAAAGKHIADLLAQLNSGYNALTEMQGDAVTGSLDEDKVKAKTVEITKLDVALNNAIVRAKNLKPAAKAPARPSPHQPEKPSAKAKSTPGRRGKGKSKALPKRKASVP